MSGTIERQLTRYLGFLKPRRGAALDLILRTAREQWSEAGESPVPFVRRLLAKSNHDVLMVCGDLRPEILENKSIQIILRDKLTQGVRLEFIFDKGEASSKRDAGKLVRRDNPQIAGLKDQFPDQIRLYWLQDRPTVDFVVVDSRHTYVEVEDHQPGTPPATVTRYDDPTLAETLVDRFRRTEELALEILVGSYSTE